MKKEGEDEEEKMVESSRVQKTNESSFLFSFTRERSKWIHE